MTLNHLRQLARMWSAIFGKGQSHESTGALAPHNGRPDFIDDKTEEMRKALECFDALQTLYTTHPKHAQTLLAVYVLWGEQNRLYVDSWVELWRTLHPGQTFKNTSTARHKHNLAAQKIHVEALALWQKIN